MSRNMVAIVSSLLFVALAALLVLLPVPYVAWRPGQTIDVLASEEGRSALSVSGVRSYDVTGSLLLTTVSTTPVDSTLSLPEAAFVFFREDSDAMPREVIYQPGLSAEEVESQAMNMMDTSRSNATVAALRAAGVAVAEAPRVSGVAMSGPAAGKLEPGDLIMSINGTRVENGDDVRKALGEVTVGEDVKFVVQRDNEELTVAVTPSVNDAEGNRITIGITVDVGYQHAPMVNYGIDPAVTGPSAGLIFALGVYDRITERSLLGGRTVAGTGAIDANGTVKRVGAVREKIKGAEKAGATVFLLPEGNCEDVAGLRTSLKLIRVGTLKDAISALQQLDENNDAEVPTCA